MALDTKALIRDIKKELLFFLSSSKSKSTSTSKSIALALAFREEGNRFYGRKKFQEALISYTKSVAIAPQDSEELCKAYGNRSAALFELKGYESCLLDVNRALKDHCSDAVLKERLLDRKKRCLARIKSSTDVEIDEDGTNPVIDREPTWRADMMSKFGNPLLPNASPKIKLKYDQKWGRHFVATADINPGETLMSEEYFIAVANKGESRFKFCDFCTTVCHAMIPCPSCTSTLYCSEQCRMMAYNQYHRMECQLIMSNFAIDHPIPIRLFLVGTKQGAALENLMNQLPASDIFEENYDFSDKPFTSDYIAAVRLRVKNFDPTPIKWCLKDAVKMVTHLQKLAFFESVPHDRLRDAEVFATALLLNNYRRRHTNRISSVGVESASEIGGDGMGEGLVLLEYMMNHSCYPNIACCRRKRENILFSVRPVKKNEQLLIGYCQNYAFCPKPIRVQKLDFVCQCEACSENWPTLYEVGIPRTSQFEVALMIMLEGITLPEDEGHETLFTELMNVVAPLLDDVALVNLEVHKIVSITVNMVSLLYKTMKPMSYPLAMFRYFLVYYMVLFYDERERDSSRNGKLSFPLSNCKKDLNNLLGMFSQQMRMPDEGLDRVIASIRIVSAIYRLNFYSSKGHFFKKNIVDQNFQCRFR